MSHARPVPGALLLIPVPLGGPWQQVVPAGVVEQAARLDYFVAERARTARQVLAQWPLARPLQAIEIAELNEHTPAERVEALLAPVLAGRDAGLMSEAGCPAVADPGAMLVAAAHRAGIRVVPLAGPSAILLALMASGLGGQRFAFHGYLPVEREARAQALRALERRAAQGETQLWIETPYRAQAMLEASLAACGPATRLAVGCDLTLPTERIVSRCVADWQRAPERIDDRLAVFALAAPAPAGPPGERRDRATARPGEPLAKQRGGRRLTRR